MSSINDYKVGMTVYGEITGIKPYGAFVGFDDGVTGLIHISEISNNFVRDIGKFVEIGDHVMLKVIDIDLEHKQLRLSFKALAENSRKHIRKVKFEGMPESIKGFKTIEEMLPVWVKGEQDD